MLRRIAITVFALIALVTPLALWIAWSRPVFWLVIAVGCAAILAILLLIRGWPDERF